MAAAPRRPAGAHAAPRAVRRSRVLPSPLSALFLGVIGGALGLAALLPPADGVGAQRAVLSARAEVVVDVPPAWDGRDDSRVSRSRGAAPQGFAAQAALPPSPVPAPPPPAPVLPGCDGAKVDLDGYANGRLPSSVLCTIPGTDEALRADAAVAFVQLAKAYEEHFGRGICLTDGYRSLAAQQAVRRIKPRLAARPGTSEHGWGLAVDLACGVQSFRSSQHAWMRENAERFGWHLPAWARKGGSKPEPWHWEYLDK